MARRRREKNKRTPATDVAGARAARLSARDWAFAIGLFVLSALLYVQVLGFEFVDYDDDQYVTQNAQVQKGLSPETIAWADGTYRMYYTTALAGEDRQCISVATSDTPAGPYTDDSTEPLICEIEDGGSIDTSHSDSFAISTAIGLMSTPYRQCSIT